MAKKETVEVLEEVTEEVEEVEDKVEEVEEAPVVVAVKSKFKCDNCEDSGKSCYQCK